LCPRWGRWERLAGAALCLALAALCLTLAALSAPLLPIRARRFALLWSLGSLCALGAVALLRGTLRAPGPAGLLYL
ncbi:SFT2C protein, partial [Piaya cayana]|nr:SFT2C protein [Piaya cayana]